MNYLTQESEQRAYVARCQQLLNDIERDSEATRKIRNRQDALEEQLAAKEQIVPQVPMHERGD